MPASGHTEAEWLTRKRRIDPALDECGWSLARGPATLPAVFRSVEEATSHGPADYALWLDGRVVAVVEARKLAVGPQNVLAIAGFHAPDALLPAEAELAREERPDYEPASALLDHIARARGAAPPPHRARRAAARA